MQGEHVDGLTVLDVSALPAGMYQLVVQTNTMRMSQTVQVMH
jgi:hypothetical protein